MSAEVNASAVVFTAGRFATPDAKTAHGLVRGPSRFRIVALIDSAGAGRDAGELLDGRARAIPTFADVDAFLTAGLERPRWLVIGVATSGGVLPADMRAALRPWIERGVGIVNGLHDLLGDDAELVALARRSGAELRDLRCPRPFRELHFWTGAVRNVRAPRIAVLGTDCALGKRTTCQSLAHALRGRGVRAAIVHTGQTGWLQGIAHGFILDATPNDFVAGELEHAIVSCDRDLAPDVILLEGQSALRNPSGPCGAELLLSGGARAVVLQHAPARVFFEDQEALENRIPSLASEIELIAQYGARVIGIALNHEHLEPAERAAIRDVVERETGTCAEYPLLDGVERLADRVRDIALDRDESKAADRA